MARGGKSEDLPYWVKFCPVVSGGEEQRRKKFCRGGPRRDPILSSPREKMRVRDEHPCTSQVDAPEGGAFWVLTGRGRAQGL